MTGRSRWLVLLGIAGLGLGVLRNQHVLSVLSLTVLIWMLTEWLWFYTRLWLQFPRLRLVRKVNGRTEATGVLWAGRTVRIEVEVASSKGSLSPLMLVHDCLPENLSVSDGECDHVLLTWTTHTVFSYSAEVGGAGAVRLSGFKVTVQDPHGFFAAERFVDAEQTFRVLPAFADVTESRSQVKRINSLPQHGIHRLQRAGLGSELLELRDYVSGDPPKSIAWKVSARRNKLMTRQYESEVPVRVHLFVDGSISTRVGGYGRRLLDQMLYVAGTVARSSTSAGDPVGAVLFSESGRTRVPPAGGERGFYRLLDALSDFANNPAPPRQQLTAELLNAAYRLAGERYPELLHPAVNQVPFSFLPISPKKRRQHYHRSLLAAVLAELHGLSPVQMLELVHDDKTMAHHAQDFLASAGVSWMDPIVSTRNPGFPDGIATMELLSKAISESVAHAKDNEVYVVMANLLECATNVSQLLPAIKMALARHHRVVVVCPTPTFRRPDTLPELDETATAEDMLTQAEQLRSRELSNRLHRALRRIGASSALSGREQAIPMILAETEMARSGRTSFVGGR